MAALARTRLRVGNPGRKVSTRLRKDFDIIFRISSVMRPAGGSLPPSRHHAYQSSWNGSNSPALAPAASSGHPVCSLQPDGRPHTSSCESHSPGRPAVSATPADGGFWMSARQASDDGGCGTRFRRAKFASDSRALVAAVYSGQYFSALCRKSSCRAGANSRSGPSGDM